MAREIRLVPIRHAHTDGDTLVHFVNNDVIMTGDFYRSLGYLEYRPPRERRVIERDAGGG